ncbi:hypothetical protein pb186bvf_015564 [Paramecium bursaria]
MQTTYSKDQIDNFSIKLRYYVQVVGTTNVEGLNIQMYDYFPHLDYDILTCYIINLGSQN